MPVTPPPPPLFPPQPGPRRPTGIKPVRKVIPIGDYARRAPGRSVPTGGAQVVRLHCPELSTMDRALLGYVLAFERRQEACGNKPGWRWQWLADAGSPLLPPGEAPVFVWDWSSRPKEPAAAEAWNARRIAAKREHEAERDAWYAERRRMQKAAGPVAVAAIRRWVALGLAEAADRHGMRRLTALGRRLAGGIGTEGKA